MTNQNENGERPLRVIKIGGSLLRNEASVKRVRSWLKREVDARLTTDIVVTGGGQFADTVRDWDRWFGIGQSNAHRMAIEAMGLQLELLRNLFPEHPATCGIAELRKLIERPIQNVSNPFNNRGDQIDSGIDAIERRLIFFDSRKWISGISGQAGIPETWDFTSDSISALLARELMAGELMLLKSVLPPEHVDLPAVAELDIVDRCFPGVAAEIPRIRIVQLHSSGVGKEWLLSNPGM